MPKTHCRRWERASRFGECLLPGMSIGELGALCECHRSIAGNVDRQGDHDRARTILEGTLRVLDNVPAKERTPAFHTHVAQTQFELGKITQRFSLQEIDHLNVEDWADRVAKLLSSIFATDSMRPLKECLAGYWFIGNALCRKAAAERHAGDSMALAGQSTGFDALAKLLVARYPDDAIAHLCLCDALSERANNAWRTHDRVAIERNWRLALDETRQVVRLNPHNATAESLAIKLQQGLNDLLEPRKEDRAQGRSVRAALWLHKTKLELDQLNQEIPLGAINPLAAEKWADRVAMSLSSISRPRAWVRRRNPRLRLNLYSSHSVRRRRLMRHDHNLDEASRTTDRIHALAKLMVARYPDQPAAHRCLCQAFSQRAKNAWQFQDRDEVERNWKLGLDECAQALRLDPQDAWVGRFMTELQPRLKDLLAAKSETQAHGRSARSAPKTAL